MNHRPQLILTRRAPPNVLNREGIQMDERQHAPRGQRDAPAERSGPTGPLGAHSLDIAAGPL